MSFAHFDELYEICLGMAEEEDRLNKGELMIERFGLTKAYLGESNRWWDEVATEILTERELLHV